MENVTNLFTYFILTNCYGIIEDMKKLFLITFLLPIFLNANLWIERANDGPRIFKMSTIIDCRSVRKNSAIPSGKIGLGVWAIDFNKSNVAIYSGHHSERPWGVFDYQISIDNNLRGQIETYKLRDLYDDGKIMYFNLGSNTEFKFIKSSMVLESSVHNPRECRYL